MRKLMLFIRTAGWLALLMIVVLSLVPGNLRPHVMANEWDEHFVAYFITGTLFAIGYSRPVQLLSNGIMLATCAAGLEIVQTWIPGRTSSFYDFAMSTFGAWTGVVLILSLDGLLIRRLLFHNGNSSRQLARRTQNKFNAHIDGYAASRDNQPGASQTRAHELW